MYYNMTVHVHCKGRVGSKNYNLTFMHLKLLTIKVSSIIPWVSYSSKGMFGTQLPGIIYECIISYITSFILILWILTGLQNPYGYGK